MIFLDESGKRWKRIKRSTTGLAMFGLLPVLALVGGSLAYHPQWSILPIIQQAAGVVLSGSLKPQTVSSGPTALKQAANSTVNTTLSLARIVFAPTSASSTPTTPASATPKPTPAPTPTPTPKSPQSASPTGGNPPQNDRGLAHKPIH